MSKIQKKFGQITSPLWAEYKFFTFFKVWAKYNSEKKFEQNTNRKKKFGQNTMYPFKHLTTEERDFATELAEVSLENLQTKTSICEQLHENLELATEIR